VAIPAIVLVLFAAPPPATLALVAVAAALALWEFFALLSARGVPPLRATGFLAGALAFLHVVAPASTPGTVLPAIAVLLLAATLRRSDDIPGSITAAALTLLGATYVGALAGTMAALRVIPPVTDGPWRVTFLVAVIMTSDSAAYFTGSAFGRRKLAPSISPAKSVEGLVGGLLGGMAAALVVRALGLPGLPALTAAALGLAVSALGVIGDLVESLLKRWAGVKDSGRLFPGHGGMLDRLDSLLFGAPVLYYYFLYAR